MKHKKQTSTARLIRKRDAALRKLAEIGPFMRGSLVTAQRGNHTAHQLTVSVKGKTHTVYVPIDMVEEVKGWIKNYRRMQELIKEVSKLSMAVIHSHIPESRAAARRKGKSSSSR